MVDVRSPLKRIGGKFASADRIVALFPSPQTYKTYVEPCCGACHIILNKPQYGHNEVINDLDNNLIAFWMEMKTNASGLQTWLEDMPYSYELYRRYYKSLFDGSELAQFDRAWRYFYCLRQTGTGWLRKSIVGWDNRSGNVRSFRSAIEVFEIVQERLHGVAIDSRDVLDTVRRYDSPDTFFYLDTPYLGTEQYYEVCKKGFPHAELAKLLQAAKAKVAFSCYPHPNIEEWYPASTWHRTQWQQYKSSDIQSDSPALATELLLTNYEPANATASLWDMEVAG